MSLATAAPMSMYMTLSSWTIRILSGASWPACAKADPLMVMSIAAGSHDWTPDISMSPAPAPAAPAAPAGIDIFMVTFADLAADVFL